MKCVPIPQKLRNDVGQKNYHDAYLVDIKLADGRVIYGLCAREGIHLTGSASDPSDDAKITFSSEEIAAVRPRSVLIPFFLTEMMRSLRRVRR